MKLFALIAVFLLEQYRPLAYWQIVGDPLQRWADFIAQRFNAGLRRHGMAAWWVAVFLPSLGLALLYFALDALNVFLGFLLTAGVLYLGMGFRQFSHHFSAIQLALRLGDLERARQALAEWQGRGRQALSAEEIAAEAIQTALLAAHRHVFAVLLCLLIFPGPSGVLLYRLAQIVCERWGRLAPEDGEFARFSQRAFACLDWLPQRATATAFAIVGNFEDALHCWRQQASGAFIRVDSAIVLASGAGALGVRLQGDYFAEGEASAAIEFGVGEPADPDTLQRAVGLVWRATVLWVILLLLLGLAALVG
ncbi:CobD/CbiB family protein [Azonexus sp.]|uniref:CobD/CbiB family protein n=1 Tax=Azonexus sp. TaxID=1872668 RepID=UPI0039E6D436